MDLTGGNIVGDTFTVDGGSLQSGIALTDIFADVDVAPVTGVLSGVLADSVGPIETIALNPSVDNPAIDSGDPDLLDETQAGVPDLNGDGDQTDVITTDARGFARDADFIGGGAAPDLGAFEQQLGQSFVVTTLDDELDSTDPNATLADFGGLTDLSLREALVLTQQGDLTSIDTITFHDDLIGGSNPGVDDGVITLAQGELVVFGNVSIDGDINGDGTTDITVAGNTSNPMAASAVFHIYTGTVTLNGLTIRDGDASYGAGVSIGSYCGCQTADVTISNSVIRDNIADYGGGIDVGYGSSLRLLNSTVRDNTAVYEGGGIYNAGDLTVINSTLFDNTAIGNGGGIANYQGTATVLNSTLHGNAAGFIGGGIGSYEGTLSLVNTTLHGNVAGLGGGLASLGGDLSVDSSTITGNLGDFDGGGIATDDVSATITNSIVAGNQDGAGNANDVAVGPVIGITPTYAGHNVLSEGTASPNVTIETNLGNIFAALEQIDPDNTPNNGDEFLAGALADNGGPVDTVMILRGGTAAANDKGVNAALPPDAENLDGDLSDTEPLPVDARGLTRVVSGIVDIGAVELQDGVAQDDAFAISESGTIVGQDVHNNNGNGPDTGDQLTVPEVNGQANGGAPFAFASGATFTVGADGTFNFNPGDAYDHLPGVGSGASNITANETFTYTLPGGDTATVTIAITGLSFNDDTLLGTLANDSLIGGTGNDSYFVENAGDAITEAAGDPLDRIYAAVSYGLAAGVSIEVISTTHSLGAGAIDLTGNELANLVYGNAGMNVLGGGGGDDLLAGLAGDDTLNGGAGFDLLYGGGGYNTMAGGGGTDHYFVDSSIDVIVEAAGDAFDHVFASVSFTLTAGAEIEIMTTTNRRRRGQPRRQRRLPTPSTATTASTPSAAPAGPTCWPPWAAPIRSTAGPAPTSSTAATATT